jgi:hypothetical protein
MGDAHAESGQAAAAAADVTTFYRFVRSDNKQNAQV